MHRPSGFVKGNYAFAGSSYDGKSLWLVPCNADRVVALNTTTGVMTGYKTWPSGFVKGNNAFLGSSYDGKSLWLVPLFADRVVALDITTGVMTGYNTWPTGVSCCVCVYLTPNHGSPPDRSTHKSYCTEMGPC